MLDVGCSAIRNPQSAIRNPHSEPLISVRLQTLNPTPPQTEATAAQPLQIQRAFRLLKSHPRHGLQVNHRGLDIAVAQQLVNRLQVIIRQQQVTFRRRIAASRSRYSCSQEAPRPGADGVVAWAPGRAVSGSGAAGLCWCGVHADRGNSCRAGSGGLAGGAALGVWGGTGGTCPPARSPLSPPPENTGC